MHTHSKDFLSPVLVSLISILSNNIANAGWTACHSYENESPINSEQYPSFYRSYAPPSFSRSVRRDALASHPSSHVEGRRDVPIPLPSPGKCRSAGWMRRHPGSSLNIQWR